MSERVIGWLVTWVCMAALPLPWSEYKECAGHLNPTSPGHQSLSLPTCTLSSSCSGPAMQPCSWFSVCSWGSTKLKKTREPSLSPYKKKCFGGGFFSYPRNLHIPSWKLFQLPRDLILGALMNSYQSHLSLLGNSMISPHISPGCF